MLNKIHLKNNNLLCPLYLVSRLDKSQGIIQGTMDKVQYKKRDNEKKL